MDISTISWAESGKTHIAQWRSENGTPAPKRIVIADDTMTADTAYHLACEGTAMLWRGDYHNARQLLQAMARRAERKPRKGKPAKAPTAVESFHLHRQAQLQRSRMLGMLLLQFEHDHSLNLKRAPAVQQACLEVYGEAAKPYVASLRELQGLIGAHEWRKKGVDIPELGSRIYPYYGVFSPVRGEYLELIAQAPLPATALAFDIGTGTGVIAALLAKRGVKKVIATELDTRALSCARENIQRMGFHHQVEVIKADLFPPGKAPLIVCNPPWIPAKPSSSIEHAIYDPESRMLLGFLNGLAAHLEKGGEGWLIMSDIAEHLGLRTREFLLDAIDKAGLSVIEKLDIRPQHPKVSDQSDALHKARAAEVTSLWRLGHR